MLLILELRASLFLVYSAVAAWQATYTRGWSSPRCIVIDDACCIARDYQLSNRDTLVMRLKIDATLQLLNFACKCDLSTSTIAFLTKGHRANCENLRIESFLLEICFYDLLCKACFHDKIAKSMQLHILARWLIIEDIKTIKRDASPGVSQTARYTYPRIKSTLPYRLSRSGRVDISQIDQNNLPRCIPI